MIEILAQTGVELAVGFGGALGGGGLVFWLVKKNISRGFDHIDNQAIHVDPNDKVVSEDVCKIKHTGLERFLEERFSHQAETLKRIEGKIDTDHRGGGLKERGRQRKGRKVKSKKK